MLSLQELKAKHPHYSINQHNADGTANSEWRALRGLGSTSISKLLSINGSVYEQEAVYNRIHGLPYYERDISSVAAIKYGNETEDEAVECFMKYYNVASNYNGLRHAILERPGLLQQKMYNCYVDEKFQPVDVLLTDSPDFLLVDKVTASCLYIGEVKCSFTRKTRFTAMNLPYYYYLQCQWHMIVSEVQQCVFVDYHKNKLLNVLLIDLDHNLKEDILYLAQFQLAKTGFSKLDEATLKYFKSRIKSSRETYVRNFFSVSLEKKKE